MSIIEEALRKLTDDGRQARQDGDHLLRAHVARPVTGFLQHAGWLVTGGLIAVGGYLAWQHLPGLAARALALDLFAAPLTPPMPNAPATLASPPLSPHAPDKLLPTATDQVSEPVPAAAAGAPAQGLIPVSAPVPSVMPVIKAAPAAPAPLASRQPLAALPAPVPALSLGWHVPQWVRQGAAELPKGDATRAVQTWTDGLEKIPNNHPLIPVPHSLSRTAAFTLYRRLAETYPTVIVVDNTLDTPAWQVMLAPEPSEKSGVLVALRGAMQNSALNATTAGAWRASQDIGKTAPVSAMAALSAQAPAAPVSAPGPAAAKKAKPDASAGLPALAPGVSGEPVSGSAAASPKAATVANTAPDPARSVVGFAVSSADAIMRRFSEVERLIAQGKFEAALEGAEKVETEVGETWQTRYFSGTAARGLHRWDEAVRALTRAHQLNPASTKVLLERAICLQELGNHEAALADLNLVRALNPNIPELALNAGYSYDALGRRDDAMDEYRKFLKLTAQRDEYSKVRAWVARRITR